MAGSAAAASGLGHVGPCAIDAADSSSASQANGRGGVAYTRRLSNCVHIQATSVRFVGMVARGGMRGNIYAAVAHLIEPGLYVMLIEVRLQRRLVRVGHGDNHVGDTWPYNCVRRVAVADG